MTKKKAVPRAPLPDPVLEPSTLPPGRFLERGHDLATETAIAAMNEDLAKHEAAVVLARKSVVKRRETPTPNPIIEFMEKKLKRDWGISSADMGDALKVEAQTGNADGRITMSDDGTAFIVTDNGKVKNRLAITSVPATVSRLKKISKCA